MLFLKKICLLVFLLSTFSAQSHTEKEKNGLNREFAKASLLNEILHEYLKYFEKVSGRKLSYKQKKDIIDTTGLSLFTSGNILIFSGLTSYRLTVRGARLMYSGAWLSGLGAASVFSGDVLHKNDKNVKIKEERKISDCVLLLPLDFHKNKNQKIKKQMIIPRSHCQSFINKAISITTTRIKNWPDSKKKVYIKRYAKKNILPIAQATTLPTTRPTTKPATKQVQIEIKKNSDKKERNLQQFGPYIFFTPSYPYRNIKK